VPETQEVINQHYVPQSYLKKFTYDGKRLYVFDKFTGRSNSRSTKSVASETRFYDFHPVIYKEFRKRVASGEVAQDEAKLLGKALDPQMIEHELAAREAKFPPLFEAVLEAIKQKQSITEEQRWNLAEFIVLQFLRTPEYRRELIELQLSVSTEAIRRMLIMKNIATDEFQLKFDEKYASLEHAQLMFDPDLQLALCQALVNHIWLIGVNMTTSHFYTSDTPIVKRTHDKHPLIGTGLGSYSVEVAFPLTPKHMLILRERTHFHDLQQLDLHTVPMTPENVIYYNSLQVFQSYRYVYCPFGEFLLAADISCGHPEICMPERKRWKIS